MLLDTWDLASRTSSQSNNPYQQMQLAISPSLSIICQQLVYKIGYVGGRKWLRLDCILHEQLTTYSAVPLFTMTSSYLSGLNHLLVEHLDCLGSTQLLV